MLSCFVNTSCINHLPGLEELQNEVEVLSSGYYAANSLTTHSMQVRRYLKFVDEFKGLMLPTNQIVLYIA